MQQMLPAPNTPCALQNSSIPGCGPYSRARLRDLKRSDTVACRAHVQKTSPMKPTGRTPVHALCTVHCAQWVGAQRERGKWEPRRSTIELEFGARD